MHLSDEGIRQAENLAEWLPSWIGSPMLLLVSPLERARETSQPLASKLGLEPVVEPRLVECDFGDWTGMQLAKLYRKREWRLLMERAADFKFPGGEAIREVSERVLDLAAELRRQHPGQSVLGFSHADPIRILATEALGMHLDQLHRVNISTASVTRFVISENGLNLETLNLSFPISSTFKESEP